MGEIRKIGQEYYIEFYARGLLYQQKAGTDEEAARRMLAEVEGKILKGEMSIVIRDVDVDIFCRDFLEDCQQKHTPKTMERFEGLMEDFFKFLKESYPQAQKLSAVTPSVCEHYKVILEQRNLKPRAVMFTFILLKDFFEFGIKLGYINDNPTTHIRWQFGVARRELKTLEAGAREKFIEFAEAKYIQLGKQFDLALLTMEIEEFMGSMEVPADYNYWILCHTLAGHVVPKGVGLTNLYLMLGFSDAAQTVSYLHLVPAPRVI